MYTIRAVLADRDHDDVRPTLVNHNWIFIVCLVVNRYLCWFPRIDKVVKWKRLK